MKKTITLLFTMALLVMSSPGFSAETKATNATSTREAVKTNARIERISEIDKMDKSNLDRATKRELRKEVKVIQKQLKASNNGGVYISAGAIIVIVLLLIILL